MAGFLSPIPGASAIPGLGTTGFSGVANNMAQSVENSLTTTMNGKIAQESMESNAKVQRDISQQKSRLDMLMAPFAHAVATTRKIVETVGH